MQLTVGLRVQVLPGMGIMIQDNGDRTRLEGRRGTVVEFNRTGVIVDIDNYGQIAADTSEFQPLSPLEQLAYEA